MIDNLKFVYDTASQNRLLKVNDLNPSPQGFNQANDVASGDVDANNVDHTEDYTYDFNGNMKSDTNKGIEDITYNHLNLPIKINFGAKGNIYYLYNAIGGKVKKVVEDIVAHITTTTDYLSGFQYLNTELQFFPHAEGYVHYTKPLAAQGGENSALGSFNYVFNYTDHLGNVRLSYARDPLVRNRVKILEENHYYAFGLKHKNYNVEKLNFEEFPDTGVEIVPAPAVANASYNYKYNGKELQEELGLNMTAMDWRQYDSAIGRFVSIDYMAEFMPEFTPYHFSYNSPVEFSDPSGLCPECLNDVKDPAAGQSYVDSAGTTHIYTPNENGNGGTWIGQIETVAINVDVSKKLGSVGQPGAMESAIPVWGSGRASIDHFQNGNYLEGTAYMALAISDVFLVKSLIVGGAKLGAGMLAKSSAGAADDVAVKGANAVYNSVEGGVTTYVGITNNVARRAAEHLSKKGISITPLMKNLSRGDAKAVEQALIEIHGLGKNGGTLINKINSISTKNPIYAKQLERGYELLKTIGY